MSTVKNVSGPYVIHTINSSDPIVLDADNVIIKGCLQISGSTTTINSTNTEISDNIIVLNKGESGSGVTLGTAGIFVDRGLSTNVAIRYNESNHNWQVTNNGTTYYNIVATTTGNTRVVDDASPQLGANLNTANFAIRNDAGNNVYIDPVLALQLDGNIQLKKNNGTPAVSVINHYNIITASNVGTGGTGLYVTNDESIVNQELISKSRAVVYSIIF
jgi:hypothetical protein